jgi:hypothetical protein
MRKAKQEKTAWTISRLRTMPQAYFYGSVISLCSGHRCVSSTARMLLALPERGGLQSATFHTLRTYLTPLHKLLQGWLNSFPDLGPAPTIFQEAREWLKMEDRIHCRFPPGRCWQPNLVLHDRDPSRK